MGLDHLRGKNEFQFRRKFSGKMFIREFVKGTYVADLNFVHQTTEFAEFIRAKNIKAVYIAPASQYNTYKSHVSEVPVYPFANGFMENSLVLFQLTTYIDIGYFEKITEIKCCKI